MRSPRKEIIGECHAAFKYQREGVGFERSGCGSVRSSCLFQPGVFNFSCKKFSKFRFSDVFQHAFEKFRSVTSAHADATKKNGSSGGFGDGKTAIFRIAAQAA